MNLKDIFNDMSLYKFKNKLIERYLSHTEIYHGNIHLIIETSSCNSVSINYLYAFGKWITRDKEELRKIKNLTFRIYDDTVYYILQVLFQYIHDPDINTELVYLTGGYPDIYDGKNTYVLRKVFKHKYFKGNSTIHFDERLGE